MASTLRKSVELEMRLRGFSPRTHKSYIHALVELARFYRRPLETLACAEVQAFLDNLIGTRKLAWATVNVYFSAYRFLYEQVLGRKPHEFSIPRRGRSGKRPGILSPEEVARLLAAPRNLKHRALLAMTYGSGLRVSEAVRLQPRHIDRGRMMLFIESGKGHKDRYTILSKKALGLLGEHWRANGPFEYFFHGRDKARPMSVGTAQSIYYQALERSGVRRVGGIHVLRHCFATYLMEQDVDIYTIKRWMGHRALVTTGRYMHVRQEHLLTVKSPLDTVCAEAWTAMSTAPLRVADVIRSCWASYHRDHRLPPHVSRAVRHILDCRTPALGGHLHRCDRCGREVPLYNSCQDRNGPTCQNSAREKWLGKRRRELLPVLYFHCVFTLPHSLNGLVDANRKLLLGELFTTVNWVLQRFARDPRWRLEGELGFLAVLHTWTQKLQEHFHVHSLVPGGVWREPSGEWIPCRGKWLFRKDSLADAFRNRYLQRLCALRRRGKLSCTGAAAALADASAWNALLAKLADEKWIVYPKATPVDAETALEYLARYTYKVAISDHRIRSLKNGQVTYSWRDRQNKNIEKTDTLSVEEFTKRFCYHIVPRRFMKIRYYGWLSPARRKQALPAIRAALNTPKPIAEERKTLAESILQRTGLDITLCPHCRKGHLRNTGLIIWPQRAPP